MAFFSLHSRKLSYGGIILYFSAYCKRGQAENDVIYGMLSVTGFRNTMGIFMGLSKKVTEVAYPEG